jgi:hypothetical protein
MSMPSSSVKSSGFSAGTEAQSERKASLSQRVRGKSQYPAGPFQIRSEVDRVPDLVLHVFEESEDAVMNLMERDSFIRFKRTPGFKQLQTMCLLLLHVQTEVKTFKIVEAEVLERPI